MREGQAFRFGPRLPRPLSGLDGYGVDQIYYIGVDGVM